MCVRAACSKDLGAFLHRSLSDPDAMVSSSLPLQELKSLGLSNDLAWRHHSHSVADGQCCSMVAQHIRAPVDAVWSVVRRFDNPQAYKRFIRSSSMSGDGQVGSMREVRLVSGLPAVSSTERLEILDEDEHVFSFKSVGGQHRLRNYRSVTTLHDVEFEGSRETLVIESYVVDIPEGNTKEETGLFADAIVKFNMLSLAGIFERVALHQPSQSGQMLQDTHRRLGSASLT